MSFCWYKSCQSSGFYEVLNQKTYYFNILKIVETCFIHHPSLAPLYPLSSSTCGRWNERWWQWGLERLCIYHLDGGIRCVWFAWCWGAPWIKAEEMSLRNLFLFLFWVAQGVLTLLSATRLPFLLREFDMWGCRFKGKNKRVFNQKFAGWHALGFAATCTDYCIPCVERFAKVWLSLTSYTIYCTRIWYWSRNT